jgi:hypothetical protein
LEIPWGLFFIVYTIWQNNTHFTSNYPYKSVSIFIERKEIIMEERHNKKEVIMSKELIPFTLTRSNILTAGLENVDGTVIIPETFSLGGTEYQITGIAARTFFCDNHITEVVIPKSVRKIGTEAFCHCEKLERVSGMEGVMAIDEGAFLGCQALKKISIPDQTVEIGDWAFEDCKNCETLTIPKNIRVIGESAFNNSGLTDITVPDGIFVGRDAFLCCKGMEEVREEDMER